MSPLTDKDQIARVEKYALSHLDRVHTITAGATKTAIAWLVALAIIWWQQLESKLTQVREAQAGRYTLIAVSTGSLTQRLNVGEQWAKKEALAKEEQLDLPFSIKFKLMPQWVPTLWLALAFGLCWYLLVSRRRVLRLSARGLRLLQVDIDAEPAYVRSLVGEAVWWLAPLPKTNGRVIDVREFHRALGWKTSTARFKLLSLLACVIILLLVETRVFYIGFCVTSYLTGLADPALWIAFTFVDSLLFVASVFLIWRWFAPTPIPDLLETENTADVPRREVIKRLGKGLLFTTGSYLWITTSTVGFASVGPKANQRTKATGRDRFRRRKKHHLVRPNLPDGFYQNKKSGTVHLTSCPTCLTSSNVDSLVPMKSDQIGEIQWNAHGIPKLLAEKLTRRELSTVPGMAGSISHDANKESQVPTPKTVTVLHPHASHRTYMVEQHALDLISKEKSAEACRFLINVIEGTSDFGLQTTMRLFDLLAGISVRFNQNECSARLMTFLRLQLSQADARDVSLRGGNLGEKNASKHGLLEVLFQLANNRTETAAEISPKPLRPHERHKRSKPTHPLRKECDFRKTPRNQLLKTNLECRLAKWSDRSSFWYARWTDKTKPVKWAGHQIA